ncbi:hypothetical protein CN918_26140 [Priestia megaterium]|nr:hypothetical protein CN918_26140 [Priestia megaterium]
MKDFYINSILKRKKNHIKEYLQTLSEVFGEVLSVEDLREQPEEKLIEAMKELERKVKITDSIIDVKALAKAIQEPKPKMAASVITNYSCSHCGKEETWKNAAVPKMCYECAEEIAQEIAYSHTHIVKKITNDFPFRE